MDPYARLCCLGFATNIQAKLPQELRDMIFRELVKFHIPNEQAEQRERRFLNEYDHNLLLSVKNYPSWFDVGYMGLDFATDLSRYYHFKKVFHLQHPDEVEAFLNKDRFNTACVPSDHVDSLIIDLSLGFLSSQTGHCRKWVSPKFETPLQHHYTAALRGFKALKELDINKKNMHNLLIRVDCQKPNNDPKFAEILVPLVYVLK